MEVFIELLKEYGNVVLLFGGLFLWYEMRGIKRAVLDNANKLETHEKQCLTREVDHMRRESDRDIATATHRATVDQRLHRLEDSAGIQNNQ